MNWKEKLKQPIVGTYIEFLATIPEISGNPLVRGQKYQIIKILDCEDFEGKKLKSYLTKCMSEDRPFSEPVVYEGEFKVTTP